jgi:hypothetical protein
MRPAAVLGLTLLALVGCDQAVPKQTETPSKPQLSEQKFVFDKSVTWAAYQKDGKWQALELNKTGVTNLVLAVERGAITYVCDESATETYYIGQRTILFCMMH